MADADSGGQGFATAIWKSVHNGKTAALRLIEVCYTYVFDSNYQVGFVVVAWPWHFDPEDLDFDSDSSIFENEEARLPKDGRVYIVSWTEDAVELLIDGSDENSSS